MNENAILHQPEALSGCRVAMAVHALSGALLAVLCGAPLAVFVVFAVVFALDRLLVSYRAHADELYRDGAAALYPLTVPAMSFSLAWLTLVLGATVTPLAFAALAPVAAMWVFVCGRKGS